MKSNSKKERESQIEKQYQKISHRKERDDIETKTEKIGKHETVRRKFLQKEENSEREREIERKSQKQEKTK